MYTVPIIPPDLRHEETIIQAAYALDCLQKTINSVFGRLDERINNNNAKVQELGNRITMAQAKIKGLIGTKKAIKIYAPARFPAAHVYRDIPLTFTAGSAMVEQPPLPTYEVQTRMETAPSVTQALHEKLVFFHVRSKQSQPTTVGASKTSTNQRQGMGSVPQNLRSVTSLLRFNTDEEVYGADNADSDINTWKRAKQFKHQRQQQHNRHQAQKQLLEPAPYSLAQAHRNQKLTPSGGLRYTPKLNEAPEINLPLDLPDLPGIADDIHFEGKDQQQIAPSLFVENLPDLPELEEEQAKKEVAQTQVNTKSMANIPLSVEPAPKQSMAAVVQPPPPPPPPPLAAAPPPPPPPPPPHAIQSNAAVVSTKPSATPVPPSSDSSNTRSALMDAIRQAGGALGGRLRAAAAAPVDVVDNNNPSSNNTKPAGGDLMADLHNKLLMRRKGISGAKENPNTASTTANTPATSSNPVLSRLSALIPPPSARRQQQTQSDDEGDEDTDWAD